MNSSEPYLVKLQTPLPRQLPLFELARRMTTYACHRNCIAVCTKKTHTISVPSYDLQSFFKESVSILYIQMYIVDRRSFPVAEMSAACSLKYD